MKNKSIAVDIGGTRIKIAVVENGVVSNLSILPAHSEGKLADRLDDIAAEIRKRIEEDPNGYMGLGLSLPCLVDPVKKRATEIYGKFEDALDIDFSIWASSIFDLPLVVEQDSKAALLGETTYGCAVGCQNALLLIMGTGVGTAVLSNGQMLDGPDHFAGSLGSHIIIDAFHGRKCTCGGHGCLEAYTSGWALPGIIREHPKYPFSQLAGVPHPDFQTLGEAVHNGDETALDVLGGIVCALRAGIISLVHCYNPDIIILSGGPTHLGKLFLDPLFEHIDHEIWGDGRHLHFLVATRPDESVLMGLHALLIKERQENGI